jgi:hypothetical protein
MHAWQWKGEWGSDERGVRVRRKGSEGQTKGEWESDERGVRVRRNCNVFNLAMENVLKGLPDKIWENVLKGLPDKIWDQLSRDHTQIHFCKVPFLNHFQIARSWRWSRFPVYIKTMQSCSSMFDTNSQSFQRQDNQEVHAISCFLSEADEMKYIYAH